MTDTQREIEGDRSATHTPMQKAPFLIALYGGLLAGGGVIAGAFSQLNADRGDELSAMAVLVVGLLILVVVPTVTFAVLVYMMWAALPSEHARTTPGKAVGLSFVPFFNLYWIFQVYPGFAADYNAYVAAHAPGARRLSTGLFTGFCVLSLLGIVPFVGYVTSLINLVLAGLVISRVCDAVNELRSSGAVASVGIPHSAGARPTRLGDMRVPADAYRGFGPACILAVLVVAGDLVSIGISAARFPDYPFVPIVAAAAVRGLVMVTLLMAVRSRILLVVLWSVAFMLIRAGQRYVMDLDPGSYGHDMEPFYWLTLQWILYALLWPTLHMTTLVLAVRYMGITFLSLIVASLVATFAVDLAALLGPAQPNFAWGGLYALVDGAFLYLGFRLMVKGRASAPPSGSV